MRNLKINKDNNLINKQYNFPFKSIDKEKDLLKAKSKKLIINKKLYSVLSYKKDDLNHERVPYVRNLDGKLIGLYYENLLEINTEEIPSFLSSPYSIFKKKVLKNESKFSKKKFNTKKDNLIKIFLNKNNKYNIKEYSLNKDKENDTKYVYFRNNTPYIKAEIDGFFTTYDNEKYIISLKPNSKFSNKEFLSYYLELQFQMYCSGARKGVLIFKYKGLCKYTEIKYNEELVCNILKKIEKSEDIVVKYNTEYGFTLKDTKNAFKSLKKEIIKEVNKNIEKLQIA